MPSVTDFILEILKNHPKGIGKEDLFVQLRREFRREGFQQTYNAMKRRLLVFETEGRVYLPAHFPIQRLWKQMEMMPSTWKVAIKFFEDCPRESPTSLRKYLSERPNLIPQEEVADLWSLHDGLYSMEHKGLLVNTSKRWPKKYVSVRQHLERLALQPPDDTMPEDSNVGTYQNVTHVEIALGNGQVVAVNSPLGAIVYLTFGIPKAAN